VDSDVLALNDSFSLPAWQNTERKGRSERAHQRSKQRLAYDLTKRTFDVIGSLVLLAMLAPLMLLCAFLVRVTSGGPVLYRQRRLTSGGEEFSMLKFRSMYPEAELHTGAVWAASNDVRVTPVGRFLRRYHLDELPQLFNVLGGSMSLIGPRPERPEFSAMLATRYPSYHRRLQVPAGLTGLAQVDHGYCSSVEHYRRKIALDRLYVRKRSLKLDMAIAAKTVFVVINGG